MLQLLNQNSYRKLENTSEIRELRAVQICRVVGSGQFLGNFVWVLKMIGRFQLGPDQWVTNNLQDPELPGYGVPGPGHNMYD